MACLSTATKGTRRGVQNFRKVRPRLLRCNPNLSGSFEMADAARGIKGWHETGLISGRWTAGHGRNASCMTRSSRNTGGEGCSEVADSGLGMRGLLVVVWSVTIKQETFGYAKTMCTVDKRSIMDER